MQMDTVCKKPDNVRIIVDRAFKIDPDATIDEMHITIIEDDPSLADNKIYLKWYKHYYNLRKKAINDEEERHKPGQYMTAMMSGQSGRG
jgi:hypothetical protein